MIEPWFTRSSALWLACLSLYLPGESARVLREERLTPSNRDVQPRSAYNSIRLSSGRFLGRR